MRGKIIQCVRLAHFGLLAAALGCFLLHADAAVQQPAAFCSRAAAAAAFTKQIYNEYVGAAARNRTAAARLPNGLAAQPQPS